MSSKTEANIINECMLVIKRNRNKYIPNISIVDEIDNYYDNYKDIQDSLENKFISYVKNKIATYASSQLEEYAGSLPIEPANKVVLMYPDWIYDKDLYLKDRKSGTLTPVKLVKKEQEDAEQSTPESTMQ